MMKYQTVSQACPQCNKQVSLFSENYIHNDQKYSFTCPYCGKESAFKASIGIEEKELPDGAVRIKLV
jgi:endogenous inhibitor of DNA gyrase (YacG/DUF329 family)